ncbi:MAG: response regulator [Candidatus Odinarchaeota archaeon]
MVGIMIVDDNEITVHIIDRLLTMQGYTVAAKAINGEHAINMYKRAAIPPEIVIMDYDMPVKNGIEATIEILNINPDCKIIFLSGNSCVKVRALESGAVAFLDKPVSVPRLLQEINRFIVLPSDKRKN